VAGSNLSFIMDAEIASPRLAMTGKMAFRNSRIIIKFLKFNAGSGDTAAVRYALQIVKFLLAVYS